MFCAFFLSSRRLTNARQVPSLEDSKANSNGKPSSNQFFTKINVLLQKRDFTTVKATVKLLQSVLFCPSKVTFDTMLAYVGDPRNLIVAMNLLRDQAAQLQFEGYHLFKVFVSWHGRIVGFEGVSVFAMYY